MSTISSVNNSNEASRRLRATDLKLPLAVPALKGIVIESMDSPNPDGRQANIEQFIISQEIRRRPVEAPSDRVKSEASSSPQPFEPKKSKLRLRFSDISVSNAEEERHSESREIRPKIKDSPARGQAVSSRSPSIIVFNEGNLQGDNQAKPGDQTPRRPALSRRSSQRSSSAISPPLEQEKEKERAKVESEFERIKAVLLEIRKKRNMENQLKLQTNNDAEVFNKRMRLGTEIETLQRKLVTDTKQTFRYIKGHDKQEVAPGQLLMDEQATNNIQNRIIVPSERLQSCQDAIIGLQEQGRKFNKFLKDFKQLRTADPDKEEYRRSTNNKIKAIPLEEACMKMLNIQPRQRRRLSARRVSSRYLSSSLSNRERPPPLVRSVSLYQPRPSIHANMIGSPYMAHQDKEGHLALPPSAVLPQTNDDIQSPQRRMTLEMKKSQSGSRLTRMKTTQDDKLLAASPRLSKRTYKDSFDSSSLSQIKEDNESGLTPRNPVSQIRVESVDGKSDVAAQLSQLSGDTPKESSSSSQSVSVDDGDQVVKIDPTAAKQAAKSTEPTPMTAKQQITKKFDFQKLTYSQATEGNEDARPRPIALPAMTSESFSSKPWPQRVPFTPRDFAPDGSLSHTESKVSNLRLKRLKKLEQFRPVEPRNEIADPQNYVLFQQKAVHRQGLSSKRLNRAKNLVFSPQSSRHCRETFSLLSPKTKTSPKHYPQLVADSLPNFTAAYRGRTRGVDIPEIGRFPQIARTTVVSGHNTTLQRSKASKEPSALTSIDRKHESSTGFKGFDGYSTDSGMAQVKIKRFRKAKKESPQKMSPANSARLYARNNQRTLQKLKQVATARYHPSFEASSLRQSQDMHQYVMATTMSSSRGDPKNSQAVLGSTICDSPATPFKKVKAVRLAKLPASTNKFAIPDRVLLKQSQISDHP